MNTRDQEFYISNSNVKKISLDLFAQENVNENFIENYFMEFAYFRPEFDNDGNITNLMFEGEKYGWGEKELFRKIAPYVKEESYIHMVGEDGEHWKWEFQDGKCYEIPMNYSWDYSNKKVI